MKARQPGSRRRTGFTLIEILAVVMIFGLLAAVVLPNFGLRTGRVLEDQAKRLAADLEFVRQRAVMTGVPHRVTFDLEKMAYWMEWYVSAERATGLAEEALEEESLLDPQGPIALSPPRAEEPAYRRLLGTVGDVVRLDDLIFIDGIETPDGYVDRGELQLLFQRDGTTDPTAVVLAEDGGRTIVLEIAPLADTVRFEYGRL